MYTNVEKWQCITIRYYFKNIKNKRMRNISKIEECEKDLRESYPKYIWKNRKRRMEEKIKNF